MARMTRSIYQAGLCGLLLAITGVNPAFAQSALTPEQLTLRVERLTELSQRSEDKLGTVQELVKKLSEDMTRLGRLIDNRAMLEMIQQVDNLAEEISLLTGEIEQQGHDLADIKKRQRELYLDVDRRLRDLESGASAQAPTGSITVPQIDPQLPATTSSSQATLPEAPAVVVPEATVSQQSTASVTQTPSVTQSEEKAAYQAAFDTLKEGRYKKAKTELKTFLTRFPNSSYAGNAQYWLGEAHYVTRNFEQGAIEFTGVLNNYPGSNKVPDAMLKLGYTFYELRQFPQSKEILEDLRKRYPKATAARLAAKRLDRIRKEGH